MTDQPTTPVESANCPDCWVPAGEQHELSCSTISLEEFRSALGLPTPAMSAEDLVYDWYGTTIAVEDEASDRGERLWSFAFDGSKALAEANGWEMLPGCMRREPVGGDDDSGEVVAYLWPVARPAVTR